VSAPTTYANPYWDEVRDLVTVERYHTWETPSRQIGGAARWHDTAGRTSFSDRYAWTITAPDTVAFVAEHVGPRVLDPLAGTGYWGYLLGQLGADVVSTDLNPATGATEAERIWHSRAEPFCPVLKSDAVDSVTVNGEGRVLVLSWPPYSEPIGAQVLAAYRGDRFVFIGEGDGGCCGGDDMWSLIRDGWHEVADHRPVQWYGMHDYVTVYERGAES
jgi:SAM-dependent methyltransferase